MIPEGLTFQPIAPPSLVGVVAAVLVACCVRRAAREHGLGPGLRWVPRVLVVVVLALMLLRPTVPAEPREAAMSNADVYLVLDTTASMGATDGPDGTSRLDQARADVVGILDQLGTAGARVSLITFDRDARTLVPLTTDVAAVARAAAILRTEVAVGSRGSSTTVADRLLSRTLTEVAQTHPDRSTVLVYLGDGEHTAEAAPTSFAPLRDLVQGGLVLGYGTAAGATMPARQVSDADPERAMVMDPSTGQPAVSRLDTGRLETLAEELGLELVHRVTGGPPPVPAPTVRQVFAEGQVMPAGSTEYTWLGALVLTGLLLGELAGTVLALVRAGLPRRAG